MMHESFGNTKEFQRQYLICQKFGFPIPFQVYESWNPERNLEAIFELRKFAEKNNPITVRQGYYHLKVLGLLTEGKYKEVVRLLKKMRMAGLIRMEWIVDDTRHPEKTSSWINIKEILNAAIDQYRSDWQEDQEFYIEVWLEKRTLRRIFLPITDHYDVHLCVGGGYQSLDMIRTAAERFKKRNLKGQTPVILYFGDLNPSGKDIPRDIVNRLKLMLGFKVELIEVALTKKDIETYNLPMNPNSKRDSRFKWFIEKYGIDYSVELDALEPDVLKQKVENAITAFLDVDKLHEKEEKDEQEKAELRKRIDI